MLSAAERAVPAQRAAARGVLSNVALVDLFGDIAAGEDSGSAAAAVASDLRSAYVDQDRDDRLSALRALWDRSEEHTSELQSLMRISYAVFCLKKKKKMTVDTHLNT